MQMTAKIESILLQQDIITTQELCQYFNLSEAKQAMINFGVIHPTKACCVYKGINLTNNCILTGTILFRDLIQMLNSSSIQIKSVLPFAAFNQSVDLHQVIITKMDDFVQKQWTLPPRVWRTQQAIKNYAAELTKSKTQKISQQIDKKVQKYPIQKKQSLNLNKQPMKQIKQVKKDQKLKIEEVKIQVMKMERQIENKKSLKIESESDIGEQEQLLRNFVVQVPNDQARPKILQVQNQGEQNQAQIKKKQEKNDDFDQEDEVAFALMCSKKKAKSDTINKVQNKNFNIPSIKYDKKTTDKTVSQATQKAKPVNKPIGKNNLFSYFGPKK